MEKDYGTKIATGSYRLGSGRVEMFVMRRNGEYIFVEDNGWDRIDIHISESGRSPAVARSVIRGLAKRLPSRGADKVLREAAENGLT